MQSSDGHRRFSEIEAEIEVLTEAQGEEEVQVHTMYKMAQGAKEASVALGAIEVRTWVLLGVKAGVSGIVSSRQDHHEGPSHVDGVHSGVGA